MCSSDLHSVLPQVRGGKLKLLAVTGPRSPLAPGVTSFREQGLATMDAVDAWFALLAPAKTPADIIAKLHQDVGAVLALPEVREQLVAQGMNLQPGTPEQLGTLLRSDLARWRKVINDARIVAD